MQSLKESRMLAAHQLGMRDFEEGKPELCPVYLLKRADERAAYFAGYRGARRRAEDNTNPEDKGPWGRP